MTNEQRADKAAEKFVKLPPMIRPEAQDRLRRIILAALNDATEERDETVEGLRKSENIYLSKLATMGRELAARDALIGELVPIFKNEIAWVDERNDVLQGQAHIDDEDIFEVEIPIGLMRHVLAAVVEKAKEVAM